MPCMVDTEKEVSSKLYAKPPIFNFFLLWDKCSLKDLLYWNGTVLKIRKQTQSTETKKI